MHGDEKCPTGRLIDLYDERLAFGQSSANRDQRLNLFDFVLIGDDFNVVAGSAYI